MTRPSILWLRRDLRLAEVARAQAVREQKQTDEFAALAHRRRLVAHSDD